MILIGAGVNAISIIVGGLMGFFIKKGLSERINEILMNGLGLIVLYVGISGTLKGQQLLVVVFSIIFSVVIVEVIHCNKRLKLFGNIVQNKYKVFSKIQTMAEGFINCTLFVCVGAMAIVGSLQSGMVGSNEVLYAKAVIDFIAALVMSSILGIGVCFAGISVFLYEACLTLSAKAISEYLTTPIINEITCVGSILMIGLALNMMKITNIKLTKYILAPFLSILFCILLNKF
ncbi:MAG: DUF554 domain-containing protein [Herbinix sp.]|nr:DUF554 domain-containing protein [Herbinix sp.]